MKDIHAFEPIWENWVIDEEIGHGSFGTVWKAHREDQFSHVRQYAAVKHISIPKQDGPGDDDIPFPSEEARTQYYRNMLNQLIVEIDAMISLRGKAYIVSYEEHKVVPKEENSGYDLFLRMELLKSVPKYLSENKKRSPDRDETIRLGIDLASALETLESRSFVHRDIKPDNIFIDEEGHFKLGDFGTARVLESTGNASTITGTPNYMAPEVYTRAGHYDQTVDIYSLGIVLYRYMNNGYLPFMPEEISADAALTRRIRGETIKAPSNADEELSAIILKACAFRPEDRYQKAKDLKRDLVRYLEKPVRDAEIPVVCVTDDGREIFRSSKKAKAGSQIRIGIEDIPYEKFLSEEKNLVSAREILVTVDASGKANPPEARFVWNDNRTLFSVGVQVICRDENQNELLNQRTECYYQNQNIVNAPAIEGYKPVGRTETEVEVLANRSTNPKQVVFEYKKDSKSSLAAAIVPAECDVPVMCVQENGKEILSSIRTCRENAANIVTAPDITGYVLTGSNREQVSVSHDGKANPDKVVFTYRTVKKEIVPAKVAVICRDDFGNELQRDYVEGKANETLNIEAPEIKGYRLVNTDNKAVELVVNENGRPSRNEVVFVYEKAKGNKLKFAIIGIAAVLLLTGLAVLLIPKPATTYEITWKNYNGDVLEQDLKVASGAMPEYNGETPAREDDNQYTYEFSGWSPSIEPVKGNASYTAEYRSIRKPDPAPDPDPIVTSYTITWFTGSGTETTTVAEGEMPKHADPVKEPDEQYTYSFAGWTPEVKEATENAAYEAVFVGEARFYTVTWKNEDGTVLEQDQKVVFGAKPEYNSTTPMKADDDRYTYIFTGWTPNTESVKTDATYVATYERKEKRDETPTNTPVPNYMITWSTGSETDTTTVASGEMPKHKDPVKEADAQYTYIFTGWSPEVKEATGNITYTATFRAETRSYKITWLNDNGETFNTTTVAYGDMPTHADLAKASDWQYDYTFTGWDPEITTVTGDATYKAIYEAVTKSYTITWQDDTGKTIDTTAVEYGEMPAHGNLVKEADQQYTYTFDRWDPAISTVTKDATYKAVFRKADRSYTITWQDDTGKQIGADTLKYGAKPSHAAVTKESDQQYTYTFDGWAPEITTVTGDAAYKAKFIKSTRSYKITWKDDAGKTIDITTVAYGAVPTHVSPSKDPNQQYTYTFSRWQPGILAVTGDATYTAEFKSEHRTYKITWKNDDGKLIGTTNVKYGTKPSYPAVTKESDGKYNYTFEKWQPDIQNVTGEATYTAVFNKEPVPVPVLQSSWICTDCKKENTSEDKFCTNCAKPRSWTCTKCHTQNSYENTFCEHCAQTRICLECGHVMSKDSKKCPDCGTETGKWKCTKCEHLCDVKDSFCQNCGTKRHLPGLQ